MLNASNWRHHTPRKKYYKFKHFIQSTIDDYNKPCDICKINVFRIKLKLRRYRWTKILLR